MQYTVNLIWDEEAKVWYSDCKELGIILESESIDELIKKITTAAPEMMELNNLPPTGTLVFVTDRCEFTADEIADILDAERNGEYTLYNTADELFAKLDKQR